MKRIHYLAIAVLSALLLWGFSGLMAVISEPAQADAPTEIRGVWLTNVDSSVLFSDQAVTVTLQQLADRHFNTVYPAVWSWGYTL